MNGIRVRQPHVAAEFVEHAINEVADSLVIHGVDHKIDRHRSSALNAVPNIADRLHGSAEGGNDLVIDETAELLERGFDYPIPRPFDVIADERHHWLNDVVPQEAEDREQEVTEKVDQRHQHRLYRHGP